MNAIIEKIRAEVNRQRNNYNLNNPYNKRAIRVCNNILSVLGDLEKEEKPIEGLEEEIYRWFGEEYIKNSEGLPILPIVQGIARHFAKWGAKHAREQMMKEAVEGIAVINANAKEDRFGYVRSEYIHDDVLRGLGRFKIIIVKEY